MAEHESHEGIRGDIQHLREMLEKFEKYAKGEFTTIKKKQDVTNGRVMELEKWRWFLAGGLGVIAIVILPIVFLVTEKWLDSLFV